jgi:tight adherence protein B
MNGQVIAALSLSLALLVLSSSPRSRLTFSVPDGRHLPLAGTRWAGGIAAACSAVAAVALLPSTTVVAGAVVGATATLRRRRGRRIRRAVVEGQSLATALDVLVGELRVGSHPVHAFDVAADETHGAVAASLRAVAARARLGADVAAGLHGAAGSSAQPSHWERLAMCWRLASDQGLAIATLMRAAQRDIAERQRFAARVASGMAGARATAAILAGLPVLGVLLGQLIGARPLSFLLSGHAGGWLLVVGATLACLGLLWSDRITERAGADA